MYFEVIGNIEEVELIARGKSIRDLKRLRKQFGPGRWRKLKGVGTVRLFDVGYEQRRFTGTKRTALGK